MVPSRQPTLHTNTACIQKSLTHPLVEQHPPLVAPIVGRRELLSTPSLMSRMTRTRLRAITTFPVFLNTPPYLNFLRLRRAALETQPPRASQPFSKKMSQNLALIFQRLFSKARPRVLTVSCNPHRTPRGRAVCAGCPGVRGSDRPDARCRVERSTRLVDARSEKRAEKAPRH